MNFCLKEKKNLFDSLIGSYLSFNKNNKIIIVSNISTIEYSSILSRFSCNILSVYISIILLRIVKILKFFLKVNQVNIAKKCSFKEKEIKKNEIPTTIINDCKGEKDI